MLDTPAKNYPYPVRDQDLDALRETGVLIYGGGKIAQHLIDTFNIENIKIHEIWDIHAEKLKSCNGIDLTLPDFDKFDEYIKKTVPVIITIFAENGCKKMKQKLRNKGFQNVIIDRQYINSLCFHKCDELLKNNQFKFDIAVCHTCPVQKDEDVGCPIFSDEILGKSSIRRRTETSNSDYTIRSMGVLITSKCNLTCVGCNHLRDHYKKEDNVDLKANMVVNDLKKIASVVSFIKTVVLVGGEAFLHPHAAKVIEEILKIPNIGILQIITNGTVTRNMGSILPLLKNERVMVEISGYGDSISKHLQKKRSDYINLLENEGVKYRYVESLMWTNFGGFNKRNFTEQKIEDIYKACCFVSNDLFDGKLFKCSRSAYGTKIGKIPDYPSDYVNVRKLDGDDLLNALKSYFKDVRPRVCNHCNGALAPSMKAGVQVDSPR
ncbi:radical SAM protein [Lentilitoribacter sp. Alg239-R112]|uniref:radical SAM protein n=1 Tax=Lentilitoribacter sp. Alg239-R112 TaxID=2305987 RepID=UPI0013A6D96B|nr:radical SAM protein [Lentilitoribacter sp. Alg239-R112]